MGPVLLRALRAQEMSLAGSVRMVLAVLTVIGVFLCDLAPWSPSLRAFARAGGRAASP
jgi:hypothetical protein